jgi:hypothetical protein
MEKLGYGPDKRLKLKVSTPDLSVFRDPAVILIDQLKEVYFYGELETVETPIGSRGSGARTSRSVSTAREAVRTPTRSPICFVDAV